MLVTRALVVRDPWATMIVAGTKTWEMRGKATRIRGTIGIIAGGTGTIVGVCDVADVIGPLSDQEYEDSFKLRGSARVLGCTRPYPKTYAWVMTNPRVCGYPVPYAHPHGAVIWVKLAPEVQARLCQELTRGHERER